MHRLATPLTLPCFTSSLRTTTKPSQCTIPIGSLVVLQRRLLCRRRCFRRGIQSMLTHLPTGMTHFTTNSRLYRSTRDNITLSTKVNILQLSIYLLFPCKPEVTWVSHLGISGIGSILPKCRRHRHQDLPCRTQFRRVLVLFRRVCREQLHIRQWTRPSLEAGAKRLAKGGVQTRKVEKCDAEEEEALEATSTRMVQRPVRFWTSFVHQRVAIGRYTISKVRGVSCHFIRP